MRATATFADPCTGARKSTDGSGANSPRGIDHGQSGEAHVPPRWSGHRGRLVAPDESARFWKATPFRAVARVSRYVPLRFTSRDTRRASHDPHEKGTGGDARDHARSASAKATRITRTLVRTSICGGRSVSKSNAGDGEHQIHVLPRSPFSPCCPFSRDADGDFIVEASIEVRGAEQARATAASMAAADQGAIAFAKTGDPQEGEDVIVLGRYGDVRDDLALRQSISGKSAMG